MAEIKWIKITTNMFDDEKIKLIDAMPERDTIHYIWIRLLVQAGKTNANGYIFLNENVPYTEEMLSTIFNRPLNTVRLALQTLSNFGMIHVQEDKLIQIANWSKHQNIEGMDKVREQNRLRKQRQRSKEQVSLPSACTENHDMSRDSSVTVTQQNKKKNKKKNKIENKKEEEEKEEDREYKLNAIEQSYFKTFSRTLSPQYIQRILELLNSGLTEDLVVYALEVTNQRQIEQKKAKGFGYTLSILESWLNKSYRTKEEVLKDEGGTETKKTGTVPCYYEELE